MQKKSLVIQSQIVPLTAGLLRASHCCYERWGYGFQHLLKLLNHGGFSYDHIWEQCSEEHHFGKYLIKTLSPEDLC